MRWSCEVSEEEEVSYMRGPSGSLQALKINNILRIYEFKK